MLFNNIYIVFLFLLEPTHLMYLAFSVYSSGARIFKTANVRDQILCLNGMKALSLLWVIAGHRFGTFEQMYIINPSDTKDVSMNLCRNH